jgi:hypothetical protein
MFILHAEYLVSLVVVTLQIVETQNHFGRFCLLLEHHSFKGVQTG